MDRGTEGSRGLLRFSWDDSVVYRVFDGYGSEAEVPQQDEGVACGDDGQVVPVRRGGIGLSGIGLHLSV